MILFVVSALALGQTLEIGGTCPGSVSVEISDLTPGGGTLALAGTPGVGLLPEGSACEGLGIGLARFLEDCLEVFAVGDHPLP